MKLIYDWQAIDCFAMEGMKSCEIKKKERNETDGWMGGREREREREANRGRWGRWYDKRERKIVIIYSGGGGRGRTSFDGKERKKEKSWSGPLTYCTYGYGTGKYVM